MMSWIAPYLGLKNPVNIVSKSTRQKDTITNIHATMPPMNESTVLAVPESSDELLSSNTLNIIPLLLITITRMIKKIQIASGIHSLP